MKHMSLLAYLIAAVNRNSGSAISVFRLPREPQVTRRFARFKSIYYSNL